MKTLFLLSVAVVLAARAQHLPGPRTQECKIRFEDNGACVCGASTPGGLVKCHEDNHSIEIQTCYCIYYDLHLNTTTVGHCFFLCYKLLVRSIAITTSTELNDGICNQKWPLHRKGRFCGQCNDSYGLAVYSYSYLSCVPCQDYGYKNWLKYFAVALLPLTLFYILAVLMRFNVTSSSLNGIVVVIQCIMIQQFLILVQGSFEHFKHPVAKNFYKTIISILAVANLDFFRWLYTPFCLHPEVTIFEVLSLDYIVALYPFFLIFMTYALVTAYDRQYRLLVCMWKPFKILTRRYRETWNIRTSLIEIFATFILLSSVKILCISVQILSFTPIYNIDGTKLHHYFALFDATIEYFGPQHLPFALLALTVSLVFVLLPLLLLVTYPCGCFHRCLNRCGLTCQTLHVFMDAFQGSYRTHPQDMRYFSALYLLLRVLTLLLVLLYESSTACYTIGVLFIASAGVLSIFQPYKVSLHNKVDVLLMLLTGTFWISFHEMFMLKSSNDGNEWRTASILQIASVVFLVTYFITLLTWKLLKVKVKAVIVKIKAVLNRRYPEQGESIEWFEREHTRNTYTPLPG